MSDSSDDESSYHLSQDEDQDYSMRNRKSSTRQKAEQKEIPDNLNEWIKNNETQELFVIRRMIDEKFPGIKLYVVPLRSSKNNVETHYLSGSGWKENDITARRILYFIEDIVKCKEKLIWDGGWEIAIRKIKYNYKLSEYYHENTTLMKKTPSGEIFKWITDYDLLNSSIYIMVTHPTKDKKHLLKTVETKLSNDQQRKKARYKKRKGKNAAIKGNNTQTDKILWLQKFRLFVSKMEATQNSNEVQLVKKWMRTHGGQVWALTQPGVFDTTFSNEKAYQAILRRIKQPQNTQRKINRSNSSRITKKNLTILKNENKLILLSSDSEEEDNNSVRMKINPIKAGPMKTENNNNNQA
eukprot:446258_1